MAFVMATNCSALPINTEYILLYMSVYLLYLFEACSAHGFAVF